MAKIKSKLYDILKRNMRNGYDRENNPYVIFNADNIKDQIKALILEIHLAAHDEAGSEAEAMKLFEQKVKEL